MVTRTRSWRGQRPTPYRQPEGQADPAGITHGRHRDRRSGEWREGEGISFGSPPACAGLILGGYLREQPSREMVHHVGFAPTGPLGVGVTVRPISIVV